MKRNWAVAMIFCAIGVLFAQTPRMTFLSVSRLTYDYPAGALAPIIISASAPSGMADMSYSGTIHIAAVESEPNSSVLFFDLMTGETLGVEFDYAISGSSPSFIALADAEAEFIVVTATDLAGELKSAVPVGFAITPAGASATKMGFDDVKRAPANLGDSSFPMRVFAVDATGLPVPTLYSTPMLPAAFRIKVLSESNPNSSATICAAYFDDFDPARDVTVSFFGGCGYFIPANTEAEVVTFEVSDNIGSLHSDTLVIEFFDEGGIAAIVGQFEGLANTVGISASLIGISMNSMNSPDLGDDSTTITIEFADLMGTESFDFEPPTARLSNGITAFSVIDDEADTLGVFVRPIVTSGTSLLNILWTPMIFLDASMPTSIVYSGANAIVAGDTARAKILLVNDYGENVSGNATMPVYIDNSTSDYADLMFGTSSGEHWHSSEYMPFEFDSAGYVYITSDIPQDDIKITFADAEKRGAFDNGYLKQSTEFSFSVLEASTNPAVRYEIFLPASSGLLLAGMWHRIDIFAVDAYGYVDTTFSGTVGIEITGSASAPYSTSIVRGRGYFEVFDEIAEDALVTITGSIETPAPFLLHFLNAESGGALLLIDDGTTIIAGETRELMAVFANVRGIAASFSGTVNVVVVEDDGDGTVTYPSTIELIGGIGVLPISDSEPEEITVHLAAHGLPSIETHIRFNGILTLNAPASIAMNETTEVYFEVRDYFGNLCTSVENSFSVGWRENMPNGSFIWLGPFTPTFDEGSFSVNLANTQAEFVEFYVRPIGAPLLLVPDGEWDDVLGYFVGVISFRTTDINEQTLPTRASLTEFAPNPFNSSTRATLHVPDGTVVLAELYDVLGKCVSSREFIAKDSHCTIDFDMHANNSGIYFAKIKAGNSTFSRRLIYIE